MLWDLAEGKRLYSLDAGDIIHALCFSPNRYWLCAATQSSIKIWDLERSVLFLHPCLLGFVVARWSHGVACMLGVARGGSSCCS